MDGVHVARFLFCVSFFCFFHPPLGFLFDQQRTASPKVRLCGVRVEADTPMRSMPEAQGEGSDSTQKAGIGFM